MLDCIVSAVKVIYFIYKCINGSLQNVLEGKGGATVFCVNTRSKINGEIDTRFLLQANTLSPRSLTC